ncbi:LOW QUALITY PROTEIN: hypothetical protein V2J09_004955 [Rumex salicifolius]
MAMILMGVLKENMGFQGKGKYSSTCFLSNSSAYHSLSSSSSTPRFAPFDCLLHTPLVGAARLPPPHRLLAPLDLLYPLSNCSIVTPCLPLLQCIKSKKVLGLLSIFSVNIEEIGLGSSIGESAPAPAPAPPSALEEKVFGPFSRELLAVMQDMVRQEVRTYIVQNGSKNGGGMCHNDTEAIANAMMSHLGMNRAE